MRSTLMILVLLAIAFVQGLQKIDAQAAADARARIDAQISSQR